MSILRACLAIVFATVVTLAGAQPWPQSKPIRMIVPTGAGLGTDITARWMAESIQRAVGQQFVIENIASAGGVAGAQAAARAAPDGYTFFFANGSALTSNQYLIANIRYDPVKDFEAVAILTTGAPFVFAANPGEPYKNVKELIAYARANPGKLSYAVDVSSGLGLVAARAFVKRAGLDIVEVPYRSTPQMIQDTMAGRVPMLLAAIPPVEALMRDGKLRPVAMSSLKRFPTFPDVSVIAEEIPGFDIDGWLTVVAPTGVPMEIRQKVGGEIVKFVALEATKQRLFQSGLNPAPDGGSVEWATNYIKREQAKWVDLAKELDLKPE